MSVFGPFYPPTLQVPVNHAERLARALARAHGETAARRAPNAEPSDAEVWLIGREREIELFVSDVVVGWRAGRLTARDAALCIERYVTDLHRGFAAACDGGGPACCRPCEITADVDVAQIARIAAGSA